MADLGADATSTAERLAQFHRVENTYLSTFQALGGLGLCSARSGSRRSCCATCSSAGASWRCSARSDYRRSHVLTMVVAENAVAAGAVVCWLALFVRRSGDRAGGRRTRRPPSHTSSGALLLFGVFVTGLLSSIVAMSAATRAPLLSSLRSE